MFIGMAEVEVGDFLQFNYNGPEFWDAYVIERDSECVTLEWTQRITDEKYIDRIPISYCLDCYTLIRSLPEVREIDWV